MKVTVVKHNCVLFTKTAECAIFSTGNGKSGVYFSIMKKNLIFTGIKHSGKTTQARLVSTFLSLPFYDLDDLVEKRTGMSVRDYYREKGKEAFMNEELSAYLDLVEKEKNIFVLSLGGGAADNESLMEKVKDGNYLIYIKRPEDVLLGKILRNGIPPFLDESDPAGSFHTVYERRNGVYEKYADLSIYLGEYKDKRETAIKILERLREEGYEW